MAIQRLFDGLRQEQVEPVIFCPQLAEPVASDPLVNSGYRVERFRAFLPVAGISAQRRRQMVSVGGNLMSFDLLGALWRAADLDIVHTHTLGRLGGIARTVALRRGFPWLSPSMVVSSTCRKRFVRALMTQPRAVGNGAGYSAGCSAHTTCSRTQRRSLPATIRKRLSCGSGSLESKSMHKATAFRWRSTRQISGRSHLLLSRRSLDGRFCSVWAEWTR